MPEVRELLWPLRGDHPEFVFTYVAKRPRAGMIKGERYPVTQAGLKSQWRRLRARAGVKGFRFHDYRHDFGTKMLRETHDIELVSKLMNHSTLDMTRRYAHVMDSDKRAALAARAAARCKTEAESPQTGSPNSLLEAG
jgi:integrase